MLETVFVKGWICKKLVANDMGRSRISDGMDTLLWGAIGAGEVLSGRAALILQVLIIKLDNGASNCIMGEGAPVLTSREAAVQGLMEGGGVAGGAE